MGASWLGTALTHSMEVTMVNNRMAEKSIIFETNPSLEFNTVEILEMPWQGLKRAAQSRHCATLISSYRKHLIKAFLLKGYFNESLHSRVHNK